MVRSWEKRHECREDNMESWGLWSNFLVGFLRRHSANMWSEHNIEEKAEERQREEGWQVQKDWEGDTGGRLQGKSQSSARGVVLIPCPLGQHSHCRKWFCWCCCPRLFTLPPVEQVLWHLSAVCFKLPGDMALCMQEGCEKGIRSDVYQNANQKICGYYAKKPAGNTSFSKVFLSILSLSPFRPTSFDFRFGSRSPWVLEVLRNIMTLDILQWRHPSRTQI